MENGFEMPAGLSFTWQGKTKVSHDFTALWAIYESCEFSSGLFMPGAFDYSQSLI